MRGAPEYKGWAAHLVRLAGEPELACVKGALEALAFNSLKNLDPLTNFARDHGRSIQLADLWRASERIEQAIPEESHSALLASAVVLILWSVRVFEQLYDVIDGRPEPGWARFPYVCAKAALKADAVDAALALVERSLDVLNTAHLELDYEPDVVRYRKLGALVEARWRVALENFAGDLRDSCRLEQPNFRAEVGALLWTLGMIPESSLFTPGTSSLRLPALRMCRQIILVSHVGMAGDPLTQYVWLEMKDREPFNIRDHTVFFGVFNTRYHNFTVDDFMPEPPSRLFAKTIIAWFRGDLDEKLAYNYLESYRPFHAGLPPIDWPVIYLRMRLLADMVAERFGWITEEARAESLEMAQELVNQAATLNVNAFLHPEWPHLSTRTTGSIFALLDKLGGASAPASDYVSALEGFRAAGMGYWLMAAPPLPSASEQIAAAALFEQERRLLTELRGAYFLILAPILPMYYRYFVNPDEFHVFNPDDPTRFQPKPTFQYRLPDEGASKGFDHYIRILGELAELHDQMESFAPEYVQRRRTPVAEVASLAAALGMHRNQSC